MNRTPEGIALSIPHPCGEDWEKMLPAEKGRYCSSCSKVIVDFSLMSEQELAGYLRSAKGTVCGRFRSDQLRQEEAGLRKRSSFFLQRFLAAVILAFGAFLFSLDAQASSAISRFKDELLVSRQDSVPQDSTVFCISGMVKDRNTGEGIPFAKIEWVVNGAVETTVMSDINGEFSVTCRGAANLAELKVSALDYISFDLKKIMLQPGKKMHVDINMENMARMEMGIIVIKPVITNYDFSSGRTISGEEYRSMPK